MNFYIGRTIYIDNKSSIKLRIFDFENNNELEFIGVKLDIKFKPEIYTFDSVKNLFEFGENRDNYFCFLKTKNEIYTLEKESNESIIGGINIYNINSNWNLFVNSYNNIVVQQNKKPFTTAYFRHFPSTQIFFIHLSYLYYCLRNYDFENKEDIKSKFESVLKI